MFILHQESCKVASFTIAMVWIKWGNLGRESYLPQDTQLRSRAMRQRKSKIHFPPSQSRGHLQVTSVQTGILHLLSKLHLKVFWTQKQSMGEEEMSWSWLWSNFKPWRVSEATDESLVEEQQKSGQLHKQVRSRTPSSQGAFITEKYHGIQCRPLLNML